MEVLDKSVTGFKSKSIPSITFGDRYIHISKAAKEDYGIGIGVYLHFVCDVDRLYFYVDNDLSGLKTRDAGRKGEGIRLASPNMIKILRNKLPVFMKGLSRFPVREAVTKWNGIPLIEVLIHKKIK